MNLNDYQVEAYRTAGKFADNMSGKDEALACGAMKINGEAGEIAELVGKYLWHGHEFDRDALIKELGDVMWYVAFLASTISVSLGEVAEKNIAKLRTRYPEGFSTEGSLRHPDEEAS